MAQLHWQRIENGLFLFRDSCNVYAVEGPDGVLLINAGTGLCAGHLNKIARGKKIAVLLTHHFRDHADGALRLAEKGAKIFGPYWEQEYLLDPEQHFRERQTWNSYDNRWDRFSPVRPLPVSDWMMDYETKCVAGLDVEVIPTPSITCGASSYIVTIQGKRLAFVGEIICAPGKIARLAPLQYDYNDMNGVVNVLRSCGRLSKARPDILLPSFGEPIREPVKALEKLKSNLNTIPELASPGMVAALKEPDQDDVEQVLPHLYRSKYGSVANTHFIVSRSGKVLSLDYGYNTAAYVRPITHHLSNRRPFLHGLDGLKKHTGRGRIDAVLATHYHDDHVNGIPLLQRLFGTECWAGNNFADLLERPTRYDRPCLWHEPIQVTRKLSCGETFYWEEIPLTLHAMSGHTRFSTLICMEIDGTRVAHTGDQIFFCNQWTTGYTTGAAFASNSVYKNGLDLGCYYETLKHLRRFRPELVLTGHTPHYRPDAAWYKALERGAKAFDDFHRRVMPLRDDQIHFGAESQAAKLKPYRVHLAIAGEIQFEGWILNPYPIAQKAIMRLIAPEGWKSKPVEMKLNPRERHSFRISLTAPRGARCRRQPIALDLTVGGRPFGQVTEALVTAGLPRF